MNKFAIAFRAARLKSGKKFREIAEFTGLSIGYLADIDNGRRNPPEVATVKKIEDYFEINDNSLVKLAKEERASLRTNLGTLIKQKPQLEELLLRGDELPPEELEEFLELLRNKAAELDDPKDGRLFLDIYTVKFAGKGAFIQ